MYLDEFIAHLQVIRAQHGDVPVWVENGLPPMSATVEDMFPSNRRPTDRPEKIVLIR